MLKRPSQGRQKARLAGVGSRALREPKAAKALGEERDRPGVSPGSATYQLGGQVPVPVSLAG